MNLDRDPHDLISREEALAALKDAQKKYQESPHVQGAEWGLEDAIDILASLPAIPLDQEVKEMIETLDWWLALPDSAVDLQGARNLAAQLRDDLRALPVLETKEETK